MKEYERIYKQLLSRLKIHMEKIGLQIMECRTDCHLKK